MYRHPSFTRAGCLRVNSNAPKTLRKTAHRTTDVVRRAFDHDAPGNAVSRVQSIDLERNLRPGSPFQLQPGCRAKYDNALSKGVVDWKDLRLAVDDQGQPSEIRATQQLLTLVARQNLDTLLGHCLYHLGRCLHHCHSSHLHLDVVRADRGPIGPVVPEARGRSPHRRNGCVRNKLFELAWKAMPSKRSMTSAGQEVQTPMRAAASARRAITIRRSAFNGLGNGEGGRERAVTHYAHHDYIGRAHVDRRLDVAVGRDAAIDELAVAYLHRWKEPRDRRRREDCLMQRPAPQRLASSSTSPRSSIATSVRPTVS